MTAPTREQNRPFAPVLNRLRDAGLRPTRQRLALARLLFSGRDRHVTAEQLHAEATGSGIKVSMATVYNTLHQFTAAHMLREVVVESGRSYFDTNTGAHHHFYYTGSGELVDIPNEQIGLSHLPAAPDGTEIDSVDVIIRLNGSKDAG